MIGLFDSGHGGLTIYKALKSRFPDVPFAYLGDHGNAPYGNRSSNDILSLTQAGVEILFERGCQIVILACNTATAVAARKLQQEWLPLSKWQGRNVLGIIAPTVEAATQTPWAVTEPQYPQKHNDDLIVLFATQRTILSNVYPEEIYKRCPKVEIVQQACPHLAGAIEEGKSETELALLVEQYVQLAMEQTDGRVPHRVILGCTHYPLVKNLFEDRLPEATRLFCQPTIVADSLEDYLTRHPQYLSSEAIPSMSNHVLLTTGRDIHVPEALMVAETESVMFEGVE